MRLPRRLSPGEEATLVEHLDELRTRLLISLGTLVVAFVIAYIFHERLIEWLWPDADRAAAATTLRSTISGLRHTLEPQSGGRASARYILTQSGGYAWNKSVGQLDLDEFLALTNDQQTL